MQKPNVIVNNRVRKQAAGRLRRIASKRSRRDVKAAWNAIALEILAKRVVGR